jgi:ring-1,2-phenylacetyl-CoA epoxidase subunit PaaE
MRQFHELTVCSVIRETEDSIRLGLDVPEELKDEFAFLPGQHLPVQVRLDGEIVRRTYSICSPPDRLPMELGIRVQPGGRFGAYAADHLTIGDTLEVMPPFGQFHANPDAAQAKTYLLLAAGSGITPVLSICRSILEREGDSQVVVFYGNRRQRTTMFIDDLYALKNRFPERLQLYFLFSQEEQEFPIFEGRLNADKVMKLVKTFCVGLTIDEAFICGPDTMIESVSQALSQTGMPDASIHAERFGAPRDRHRSTRGDGVAATGNDVDVKVIMDGHKTSFAMASDGMSIVDAAAAQGVALPFSCKGGVCATCRTHLRSGEVNMDLNYGLEPWELESGYILACQSRPLTKALVLDYDKC